MLLFADRISNDVTIGTVLVLDFRGIDGSGLIASDARLLSLFGQFVTPLL
jgi:hypothetical protein